MVVVRLDGLIGDTDRAAIEECPRQSLVRREVQIREEDEPFAQLLELRREGFLDL